MYVHPCSCLLLIHTSFTDSCHMHPPPTTQSRHSASVLPPLKQRRKKEWLEFAFNELAHLKKLLVSPWRPKMGLLLVSECASSTLHPSTSPPSPPPLTPVLYTPSLLPSSVPLSSAPPPLPLPPPLLTLLLLCSWKGLYLCQQGVLLCCSGQ